MKPRPRSLYRAIPHHNAAPFLNSMSSAQILKLFEELHAKGMTIIMVTHDDDIAEHCERIVRLRDGLVESDIMTERGRTRANA